MRSNATFTVLAMIVALSASGCFAKYSFPASETVPAAQAEVKLTRDGNGNVEIDFKAKHLAGPEDVVKGSKVYVLWAEGAVLSGPAAAVRDWLISTR